LQPPDRAARSPSCLSPGFFRIMRPSGGEVNTHYRVCEYLPDWVAQRVDAGRATFKRPSCDCEKQPRLALEESRAARRNDRADPRCRRSLVLEAWPVRRDAEGR